MRIALFLALFIFLCFYGFQAVRAATGARWIHIIFLGVSLVILLNFLIRMLLPTEDSVLEGRNAYAFGYILAWGALQLILILFLFSEDIVRVLIGLFSKKTYSSGEFYMPSRRSFISRVALGLGAIPFASLLYGMYKGKYDFRVLKYELEFEDLPDNFDGYQITQISDVHCGSFDNKKKIAYGVEMIKDQQSDAVFFTGDLVNNLAKETEPWIDLFGSIEAPDGVYSVMGNHDYGDYHQWKSANEKEQNLKSLHEAHKKLGWDLLLNENRVIERDGQQLHVVGVENWGTGNFSKYGDLDKAGEGLTPKDFKILLSHDPSHWEEKVQKGRENYQLTLSGHTHGMQFGIEIPGVIKWSPVKYRYTYWAGIYRENGKYLNVNRGFGYLAYPGRVGMWPEITVIKLKKKRAV